MDERCPSCHSLNPAGALVCEACEEPIGRDLRSPIVNAGEREYRTLALYAGLGLLGGALVWLGPTPDLRAATQILHAVTGLAVILPVAYAFVPGYRGQQGCAFGCSLWMLVFFSGALLNVILQAR